ncbi:MAG: HAD hydrolase-like protein, partial [Flavobacteriaceae bacterium]
MSKIKAIIFDMDGVLIEAKDWHYEALNKALGLFGMEISRYDHLVTFDGLPTRKKLEMISIERSLPMKLHGFINELKQQYTMDIVNTKCKPRFYHEYVNHLLQTLQNTVTSKLKLGENKLKNGWNCVLFKEYC